MPASRAAAVVAALRRFMDVRVPSSAMTTREPGDKKKSYFLSVVLCGGRRREGTRRERIGRQSTHSGRAAIRNAGEKLSPFFVCLFYIRRSLSRHR